MIFNLEIGLALWLGILTSLSPCPLATNIAAISFIGRQVNQRKKALLSGLFYTAGRTFTYVLLGAVLVSFTHAIPSISMALQRYMNIIIGPALFIIGLFLLGVFKTSSSMKLLSDTMQRKLTQKGLTGAFLIGVFFALSFCPVSAALFFGNTIALAIKLNSRFLIPALYGLGTALPVFAFAILVVYSVHMVGRVYNKLAVVEKWSRGISGAIFILAGIYYVAQYF